MVFSKITYSLDRCNAMISSCSRSLYDGRFQNPTSWVKSSCSICNFVLSSARGLSALNTELFENMTVTFGKLFQLLQTKYHAKGWAPFCFLIHHSLVWLRSSKQTSPNLDFSWFWPENLSHWAKVCEPRSAFGQQFLSHSFLSTQDQRQLQRNQKPLQSFAGSSCIETTFDYRNYLSYFVVITKIDLLSC